MTDETNQNGRNIGDVVPFVRGEPRVSHSDETKTIALILYAGPGARSPAAVERLLPSYLTPLGLPVPTQQTIGKWAAVEDWNSRADDLWRNHPEMGFDEIKRLTVGTLMVLARQMHEMVTGVDQRPIEERVLSSKQYELGYRIAERIPQLARYTPPEKETNTDDLPRDEQEALARQALKPSKYREAQ